jgi:hypothetical protein
LQDLQSSFTLPWVSHSDGVESGWDALSEVGMSRAFQPLDPHTPPSTTYAPGAKK